MATGDFFNAADMADLREAAASAMSGSAVIRRLQTTANGMGGFDESRLAVGTVPCHVWEGKPTEVLAGGRIVTTTIYNVSVPYDTNVNESDWLDVNNITYMVTGVPVGVSWKPELKVETVVINQEQRA